MHGESLGINNMKVRRLLKIKLGQDNEDQKNSIASIAPEGVRSSSRKLVPLIKAKSTAVHNFLFFSHFFMFKVWRKSYLFVEMQVELPLLFSFYQ